MIGNKPVNHNPTKQYLVWYFGMVWDDMAALITEAVVAAYL